MGIDALPMIAFLGAADKWLRAIESHQLERAAFLVGQLRVAGKLLAIDPEFKRIYSQNRLDCPEADPEQALLCMDAFLHAITDASRPGRFRDLPEIKGANKKQTEGEP